MIWKEFILPRTHPGMTRCPATHSSDPAKAQATPATAAHAIRTGSMRMKVNASSTTIIKVIAREVIAFGEVLCRR